MAVAVALTEVPGLPGRVCNPDGITLGETGAVQYQMNFNNSIRDRSAFRPVATYNVPGLTGTEVLDMYTKAEENLVAETQKQPPPHVFDILISGILYPDMFPVKVTPSGGLTVGTLQTVNQTTIVYESNEYRLT